MPAGAGPALALAALSGAALARARPRSGSAAALAWLFALAAVAATAGLGVGALRVAAIDDGALRAEPGRAVEVEGAVASAPRVESDGISFELHSSGGRVLVRGHGSADLPIGSVQRVRGRIAEPEPWRAGTLARHGIAVAIEAERIEPTGERRGGPAGRIDGIRERAEAGLGRGMPKREAALARGFVLGQDDRIDGATREDFRRSGLAHLLAVSGQNVVLLCLLAWPFLALLGLTLRARLLILICLIALYVPVTGGGASIQRAAVMGAAGLVAALADRPASRWYALLLAAALTLALNPRAAGDIGWQLSFAAVIGILLWTGRLAALLDGGAGRGSTRRALAEGVAVTAAATLATAPLMAHHFDSLSLAALPANLLALPAVAPAMWLGMLTAAAAQLPAIPVEPLNWLNSLCLAYIAQVARWLGSPGWALLDLRLGTPPQVGAAYLALIGLAELGLAAGARRRGLAIGNRGARLARSMVAAAIALAIVAGALSALRGPDGAGAGAGDDELIVRVLDVGQGDAILLDPPEGLPVLIDAGPPGAGVGHRLRELGVGSLGALVITHADSDHAGGEAEVLDTTAVERVVFADAEAGLLGAARAAGVEATQMVEGGEVRSGELRLSALWPPRELAAAEAGVEPNQLSLVLLAEWRHFSMLLTGDAEAEAVPLDPGPVDVLKLAHHGSADAGLGSLLDRAAPRLAVISVGDGNPYGHPAPETLRELGSRDLRWLRTDETGEITIRAGGAGWAVAGRE
jgi:competence protein ComEC